MQNIILIKLIFLLIFLTSCQTIKEKTDAIVEKENEKLSKYIGKTSNDLQMDLGKPDEDFKNEKVIWSLFIIQKNMEFPVKEDLKLILILS